MFKGEGMGDKVVGKRVFSSRENSMYENPKVGRRKMKCSRGWNSGERGA